METNIKQLIRLNLEIEGALRVFEARKSEVAKDMLVEKVRELNRVLAVLAPDIAQKLEVNSPDAAPDVEVVEKVVEVAPTPEAHASAPEVHASASEAPAPTPEVEATVSDVKPKVPTSFAQRPSRTFDEVMPAPDPRVRPVVTPSPTKESAIVVETPTPAPEEVPAPTSTTTQYRLEDVIARREAKSLVSSFTINDKFRFIRSIFNSDRKAFEDSLAYLSKCESLGDAYDYLLNEKDLDVDDDEVKDFINIIANHFNAL